MVQLDILLSLGAEVEDWLIPQSGNKTLRPIFDSADSKVRESVSSASAFFEFLAEFKGQGQAQFHHEASQEGALPPRPILTEKN